jgi:hypothetical protein
MSAHPLAYFIGGLYTPAGRCILLKGTAMISDGRFDFLFIEDLNLFEVSAQIKFIFWSRKRTDIPLGMTTPEDVDLFAASIHFEDGFVIRPKVTIILNV